MVYTRPTFAAPKLLCDITTDALTVAPMSGKGPMRFSSIQAPQGGNLEFTLSAVCIAPPNDGEWGMTMRVSTTMDNVARLTELETWLVPATPAKLAMLRVASIDGYERRPTLNTDMHLILKLKSVGGVFKFTSNDPTFEPATPIVAVGELVVITLGAGFYFNEEDKKYGLFYTVKDVCFGPAHFAAQAKAKQALVGELAFRSQAFYN